MSSFSLTTWFRCNDHLTHNSPPSTKKSTRQVSLTCKNYPCPVSEKQKHSSLRHSHQLSYHHFHSSHLKHIWYLDFGLQHCHPGIFIFRRIRSRENRGKYPINGRGLCARRITHQSPLIACKSISVVRLRQFEGNIDTKVPLSATLPIVSVRLNAFTGFLFCRSLKSFSSARHLP